MGWAKSIAAGAEKASASLKKTADGLSSLKDKNIKVDTSNFGGGGGFDGNNKGGKTDNKTGGKIDTGGNKGGSKSDTIQYVTVYASNTNDIANKLAKAAKNGKPIGNK